MNVRIERLLENAQRRYWDKGLPLPLNIAAQLIEAGLDVEQLERMYRK
jgi:hypothetical protein